MKTARQAAGYTVNRLFNEPNREAIDIIADDNAARDAEWAALRAADAARIATLEEALREAHAALGAAAPLTWVHSREVPRLVVEAEEWCRRATLTMGRARRALAPQPKEGL